MPTPLAKQNVLCSTPCIIGSSGERQIVQPRASRGFSGCYYRCCWQCLVQRDKGTVSTPPGALEDLALTTVYGHE